MSLDGMRNALKANTKYMLMHKDILCAELDILDKCNKFNIIDSSHLPPFLQGKYCSKAAVDEWINSRVVLPNRENYDRLKTMILDNSYTRLNWALDNHCLSLSDCYWVKREDEIITWSDINYFTNEFSNELIDIYLDSKISNSNKYKKLVCAGSTVTASLPKTWIYKDNKRLLYKRGKQEVINEEFISLMLDSLKWKHVKYWQATLLGFVCSVCETMSTNDIELITAYELTHGWKKSNNDIKQFVDFLSDDMKTDFYKMNLLDYIVGNYDRHWNNFGIIRNSNTLDIIGLAPIYDNGNSLWNDSPYIGLPVRSKLYDNTTLMWSDKNLSSKYSLLNAIDYAMQNTNKGRYEEDFKIIYNALVAKINELYS